ncbi:MAG: hypothetical protein QOJ32_1823, partial [Frankiaceae bacterium]|nr:hypothetical protein [Frankiaceae bacterium]
PVQTVTRGNVTFTVSSYLTTVTTPATADSARRIVVQVTWPLRGRTLTAQIDALRSPVFAELSGTSSSSTTTTPSTAPAAPVGTTSITAVTTPAGTPCLKNTATTDGFVLRATATNAVATDSIVVRRSATDPGFANAVDGTGTSTAMNFDVTIPATTTFPGAASGQNSSGTYSLIVELTKSSDATKVTGSGSFAYTSTNQC